MADVFVSYAREDEARVAGLVRALQSHGLGVFWDRQIPPGRTWREHIGAQLAGARCVVVAWSKHSIGSDFVAEEADDARQRGALVPVLIDPVLPPLGFRSLQAADLCDLDADGPPRHIEALLRAIDAIQAGHAAASGAASTGGAARAASPPLAAGPISTPSPGRAPAPNAAAAPRRHWRATAAVAALAVAVVGAWLGLRDRPAAQPTEPARRDDRAQPPSGVRVVEAWRTDDGGVAMRVQVQHRGAAAITVDAGRDFALLGPKRAPVAPSESRPLFETLQPGEPVNFELRFAAGDGARALRVRLAGDPPRDLPLPPLR
jgi:hypothetical protein